MFVALSSREVAVIQQYTSGNLVGDSVILLQPGLEVSTHIRFLVEKFYRKAPHGAVLYLHALHCRLFVLGRVARAFHRLRGINALGIVINLPVNARFNDRYIAFSLLKLH